MNKSHEERDRLAKERFPWPHFCVVHPDVLARRNDFKAGFDAATEIHQHILAEKEKRIDRLTGALNERWLVEQITKWKHAWMDVKGTDERDRENYFRRAFGVDANMKYDLARRILAALQENGK